MMISILIILHVHKQYCKYETEGSVCLTVFNLFLSCMSLYLIIVDNYCQ